MDYVWLFAGFLLLVKGGDYLVRGGTQLSLIFGVSPLLIGLGVAALGTSAPEAAVSIQAAIGGYSAVSLGNIVGSNVANIGLALGLSAFLFRLRGSKSTIYKEIPFSLLAALLLLLFCLDPLSPGIHVLSRLEGFILLGLFGVYLYYLVRMARSDRKKLLQTALEPEEFSAKEILLASLMTLGGIAAVIGGGHLAVNKAVSIARSLEVSDALISVTVVALGTSLPEVVTTLAAMRKGHWDMAMGNVVGSNVFNILFVLGSTAAIRPLSFPDFRSMAMPDLLVVIGLSVLLFVFLARKKLVSKPQGGLLLAIYVLYVVLVIIRK